MKEEIELQLVPQPGSKPELLAKLAVVDPSPVVSKVWSQIVESLNKDSKNTSSSSMVLEAYTRDGWSWKPASSAYQTIIVQSTDGRHKLPGFLKYLKERQKSAFGRFGTHSVWVVSYIQSKQAATAAAKDGGKERMECRIALDCTKIPGCPLKPRVLKAPKPASAKPKPAPRQPYSAAPAFSSSSTRKGGGGLLGKLVGAQHRTNQHVISSTMASRPVAATAAASSNGSAESSGGGGSAAIVAAAAAAAVPSRTAQDVLVEFRQSMEQKMLDFDEASDQDVLRVELNLTEHTVGLSDADKQKVTMEILKYMVYEASEEVNDEWVAHKEPSEFMDEVTIAVYKEGAAPPEVLEEVNRGELPEEVKGQQRALAEERMRKDNQAESKRAKALEMVAHQYEDGVGEDGDEGITTAALGTKKRDRRTVEEYELEKKRGRTE